MSQAGRPIRTFGRMRSRPLKPGRAALMAVLLPKLTVPMTPFEPLTLAPGVAEVWLEIGFGGGEHLAAQALERPGVLVIGAETFVDGVASLLRHVEAKALSNVRIHAGDA